MFSAALKPNVIEFPDVTAPEIRQEFRNLTRLVEKSKSDPDLLDNIAAKILENTGSDQKHLTETLRTLLSIIEQQVDEKHTDTLTGAFNRRYLQYALEEQIEILQNLSNPTQKRCPSGNKGAALLHIDLDCFKRVNDVHGHAVGDATLVEVTKCLAGNVREFDVVARVGGDEFMILLKDISQEGVAKVSEKIRESVSAIDIPLASSNEKSKIGASIGAVILRPDHTVETLTEESDAMLYEEKVKRHQELRADK